jgi:HPt (histidine-containing phosphotransfer) domain-containing protein
MKVENIINIQTLRERLDGDFALLVELAQLFLADSPKLVTAVEDALKSKNSEKLGKSSHTIKGAVSNFSAERAFNAAFELEKIGKNAELDKAEAAFEKLKGEIESMREALKLLIERNSF